MTSKQKFAGNRQKSFKITITKMSAAQETVRPSTENTKD
jgi:hypothetical protein